MLVAILEKGESFRMMRALREIGVAGGTILPARTAGGGRLIMRSRQIDVLTCFIDANDSSMVFGVVAAQAGSRGHAYITPASGLEEMAREEEMVTDHQILEFIVEHGNSEAMVKAAKMAGAINVVIVDGLGTALREDEIRLSSAVSVKKDVVFITVENSLADKVAREIVSTGVLEKTGSGIGFRIPVEKYMVLGKQ